MFFFRKPCFFPRNMLHVYQSTFHDIFMCWFYPPTVAVYPATAMTHISISGLLGIILHIARNWEPIPLPWPHLLGPLGTPKGTPWDPLGPACTQSMPSQTPRSMFPTCNRGLTWLDVEKNMARAMKHKKCPYHWYHSCWLVTWGCSWNYTWI
jgi:hypothetical protein